MPLMRSAGVALLIMSRPAYARRAVAQAVSAAQHAPGCDDDRPESHTAMPRGGFGQLGDCLTPSDMASA